MSPYDREDVAICEYCEEPIRDHSDTELRSCEDDLFWLARRREAERRGCIA